MLQTSLEVLYVWRLEKEKNNIIRKGKKGRRRMEGKRREKE
jgi:hypothetical protein